MTFNIQCLKLKALAALFLVCSFSLGQRLDDQVSIENQASNNQRELIASSNDLAEQVENKFLIQGPLDARKNSIQIGELLEKLWASINRIEDAVTRELRKKHCYGLLYKSGL